MTHPELATLTGACALVGVVAYGVLAGADFGGGIWDLSASGPRRTEQRRAIARAMAPVWEANHVWLIFVIVLLFGCFPRAFAALSVGLFTPFPFALVGITLRGAAFVFRAYGRGGTAAARWGAIFGAASAVTPILLGMAVGAVSARGLAWTGLFPVVLGAFAFFLCAYVAAVFLTVETEGLLQVDFRARALFAGTVVVVLSCLLLPVTATKAPQLFSNLFSWRAVPVLALGAGAALTSGWALWQRRYQLARVAAIGQVSLLILGWGLGQYPYLVYPEHTLTSAAAPESTLRFVLWTLPPGALVLGPSLWLLFRVFKAKPARQSSADTPILNVEGSRERDHEGSH